MKYGSILEVRATHTFYSDGRCSDVAFEPTIETATLLRNCRCVIRSTPGRIVVSTALEDSGVPMLPLPVGTSLNFSINATNLGFSTFTDLSSIQTIQSRTVPRSIQTTESGTVPTLHTPSFTNANRAATYTGELELIDADIPKARTALANVRIVLKSGGVGRIPPVTTFTVPFSAKAIKWAYYCVTDLADAVNLLRINDTAGGAGAILFQDADRRSLDAVPDAFDEIGKHLVVRNVDKRVVRFVSRDVVPLNENNRRTIEFSRLKRANKPADFDRVSTTLGNPSIKSVSRINLAQPNVAPNLCDVLTHIFEYWT